MMNKLTPLKIDDSIEQVCSVFDECSYSHLPVVNGCSFLGCIAEEDVRCFDAHKKINDYSYALASFFSYPDCHWLEHIEAFLRNESNIIPILERETNHYIGCVEFDSILDSLNDTPFLKDFGVILVLEKELQDYSLGEICQIVESNQGKFLGAFISKLDAYTAQITVKITAVALNEILQSFRRYGYHILSAHQEDVFLKTLKERSDYLTKYLEI